MPWYTKKKNEFKLHHKDIKIYNSLDAGGCAKVCFGTWKNTQVAIKKLKSDKEYKQEFMNKLERDRKKKADIAILKNERDMMAKINLLPASDQHFVKFYGYTGNKIPKALVIEYIKGGNLLNYLYCQTNFDLGNLYHISLNIAYALKFLHQNNFIHGDIKLENIMVDFPQVKLIDFGFTCTNANSSSAALLGTLVYTAPELVVGFPFKYTPKTDMYAYSMVTYMMYARKPPYPTVEPEKIFYKLQNNIRPIIPDTVPNEIVNLITATWMQNPILRYSATQTTHELEGIIKNRNLV